MNKFKKGDEVTLVKNSPYYEQCLRGDTQMTGVIRIIYGENFGLDHIYSISWSNGIINSYREIDIESILPPEPKVDFLSVFTEEQKQALINFINEQIETKLKKYE